MEIRVREKCPDCDGSGGYMVGDGEVEQCQRCDRTGYIYDWIMLPKNLVDQLKGIHDV